MKSFFQLLIVLALFPFFSREAKPTSYAMPHARIRPATHVDALRCDCKRLAKPSYLMENHQHPIPPDTATFSTLTLPNGSVILLSDRPDGTLLLDQDGCKIVQHDSSVLLFYRLNSKNGPQRVVFDEKFTLYVPPTQHLVLIIVGGARIALEPGSRIAFFPSDTYHPARDYPLDFFGEASFEFEDTYFSIVSPNLKLSGRGNFSPALINIKDCFETAGTVIDNYSCNLSMTGYGTQTTISPLTKTTFYGNEKNHFEPIESHVEPIYFDRFFIRPEGIFTLYNKTAPMVLREFVKWYGLKGFLCKPGIDTNKVEFIASGELGKGVDLCDLERFGPSAGYQFSILHDSIFISPFQRNQTFTRVRTKVQRFP